MLDKTYPETLNSATSQTDIAYQILHAALLGCTIAPGEEVSEAGLAKRFNIGKGAVRLALARLRQQGLVTVMARRGYRVAPITLRKVRDVFEMLRILEPIAARRAAGLVDADRLHQLDAVCTASYNVNDPVTLKTFIQAERQFHVAVAEASGNHRLATDLYSLWDEVSRLFNLGRIYERRNDGIVRGHKALVAALTSGNAAEAERLARDEINTLFDLVVGEVLASDSAIDLASVGTGPAHSVVNPVNRQ